MNDVGMNDRENEPEGNTRCCERLDCCHATINVQGFDGNGQVTDVQGVPGDLALLARGAE